MATLSFLTALLASNAAPNLGWSIPWRLLVPAIILGLAVALFAYAGKGLHRDQVQTRGQLLTAWAATVAFLCGYVGFTVWSSQTGGFWTTFLTTACLATAATISLRTVLAPRPDLDDTLTSLAVLLGAAANLLRGVGLLTDGDQLSGFAVLILSAALLLFGIGSVTGGDRPWGAGFLLAGTSVLVGGFGFLTDGHLLHSLAFLSLGVGFLLLGAVFLVDASIETSRRGRDRVAVLLISATLLLSTAGLLLGAALVTDGSLLVGIMFLLFGIAIVPLGVGVLGGKHWMWGAGNLLGGVAVLLGGVGFLTDGHLLFGVAGLLLGVAGLFYGIVVLTQRRSRGWAHQLQQYLRAPARRDVDPST